MKRTQIKLYEEHRYDSETEDYETWVFVAKDKGQLAAKKCDKAIALGTLFNGKVNGSLRKPGDFR